MLCKVEIEEGEKVYMASILTFYLISQHLYRHLTEDIGVKYLYATITWLFKV